MKARLLEVIVPIAQAISKVLFIVMVLLILFYLRYQDKLLFIELTMQAKCAEPI